MKEPSPTANRAEIAIGPVAPSVRMALITFRGVLRRVVVAAFVLVGLGLFANPTSAQQGTFVPTGSLNSPRGDHTATLLDNGMVLIAGGEVIDSSGKVSFLASAELYDPTTGTFTPTGSLNTARFIHTATLLNNGMVLIVGGQALPPGYVRPIDLTSAELYDPTSGVFTATGNLNTARVNDTATLLNNGLVLIAGGQGSQGTLVGTAELYNPTTGTFTNTGNLITLRTQHTATLLQNGEVLIAGGGPAQSELYNPTTGIFDTTGSMNTSGDNQTASLLNNGTVLVEGGVGGMVGAGYGPLASSESYNANTGTFTVDANLNTARYGQTGTLLNNGSVLVAGGYDVDGNSLSSAELYELVALVPSSLSFPSQAVGTASASQTITLTNNESTAINISSLSIAGANSSDFAETDNCVGNVSVGATCSIAVTFTPASTGLRTATLTITNNVTESSLVAPLSGTGAIQSSTATLSQSNLAFTSQIVGTTSAAQQLTLSNTGNSVLTIASLIITGANASDFGEIDNCGGGIAAGANCTISVTFSPTSTGARTGTLTITDNATSPPSPQTVSLAGTAVTPSVSVTPSSISFPSQYVGTSGLPQGVTLTNTGVVPLSINGVTASPGDFAVLSSCGSSLAVGASCSVGVFFDPAAGGARAGTLTINDNAPRSPQTVALSGEGEDFSLSPGSSSSTTVSAGQTAMFSLTVSPAGGFNQMVTFACSGAPALSTCTVSPSSVSLSAAATVSVSMTTSASASIPVDFSPVTRNYALYLLAVFVMLSMGAALQRRHARNRSVYALSLLLFLGAGLTLFGCGGGSSASNTGGGSQGTSPGTYTLTVSGTFAAGSTTLNRDTTLSVVVR